MALRLVRNGKYGEREDFALKSSASVPEEMKAELPFKRLWALVPEE